MNRHAVAFVSVFSLTLVLSVYYLMIPQDQDQTQLVGGAPSDSITMSDAHSYYFEALKKEKREEYQESIQTLEESLILATDNLKKSEILNEIAKLEQKVKDEEMLESKLVEVGYSLSYVKINPQDICVVVYENQPSEDKASSIILLILNNYDMTLPVICEFKS